MFISQVESEDRQLLIFLNNFLSNEIKYQFTSKISAKSGCSINRTTDE